MNQKILIHTHRVSRNYGRRQAIADISITVNMGEIIGFLGPNGAGKSTLMQILCGVLAASAGTVTIAGFDLMEHPRLARSQLGYLPEQPPVYPDCTVDEYLTYAACLRGLRGRQIRHALIDSKRTCGLGDTGGRVIGNLSKGYQQRVGIAQAIIHDPVVLVLDEPGSGLDPNQMLELRELILEMRQDRCIVLSTHVLAEARNCCDRVLILHGGRVVLDQDIASLRSSGDRQVITASFHSPPESLAEISALDGVHAVTREDGHNRFRITCANDPAVTSRLAEMAAAKRWGLFELFDMDALEQRYIELTGKTAGPGGTAV